jgi:M6 family metalloprotease-like protein
VNARRHIARTAAVAAVFIAFARPPLGHATPAAPGVQGPSGPVCRINKDAMTARIRALKKSGKGANAPVIGQPPTDLTPHVLVLRIQFSNRTLAKSLTETQSFFTSLRDFYVENSYGVFVPTFTISGVLTLSGGFNTYGADCGGDIACNDQTMFNDAKTAAQAAISDFSAFDHVMLYHAGSGQETTGVASDIWSVYFPDTQSLGGKSFPGFTVVPESEKSPFSPLGVIAHEYGHQLGLPDLYDTSVAGGRSTVGAWDIMDYPYTGTTLQDGSNPPHLGAWSKKFLGFSTVQSAGGTLSLGPAESTRAGFEKISVSAGGGNEYFLLEYRRRDDPAAAYDKGIVMSGLIIWHIDDDVALGSTVLSNNAVNAPSLNFSGHRGVEVVEADGQEPNPSSNDLGLGDAFVDGQTFNSPESDTFSGQTSGVTVGAIAGAGSGSLNAGVSFLKSSATLTVLRTVNYPNPAGDPARYPPRSGAPSGTVTTFALHASRPVESSRLSLDLYSLRGDRILSADGPAILLRLGTGEPSTDFKWVYEFDWNGRNDDGEDVASGVYFYRFKADGELRTGKVAIVR